MSYSFGNVAKDNSVKNLSTERSVSRLSVLSGNGKYAAIKNALNEVWVFV